MLGRVSPNMFNQLNPIVARMHLLSHQTHCTRGSQKLGIALFWFFFALCWLVFPYRVYPEYYSNDKFYYRKDIEMKVWIVSIWHILLDTVEYFYPLYALTSGKSNNKL